MAEGSKPQRERTTSLLCADGVEVSTLSPRVFRLTDPTPPPVVIAPAPQRLGFGLLGASLVAAALCAVLAIGGALPKPAWAIVLTFSVPIALGLAAASLLARKRLVVVPATPSPPVDDSPRRALHFDGRAFALVWRHETDVAPASSRRGRGARDRGRADRTPLARADRAWTEKREKRVVEERRLLGDVGERFGVTLLSNRKRDRLAAAITSPAGCFLVSSRLSPAERKAHAGLLGRATVISSDEVALDAIGPDGEPIELASADFRTVIETLESRDPSCTDRVLLSDPSGAPLLLDGEDLEVRGRHFDLTRPLEWRSILFQEQFGQALTLYQGTWIRQGVEEVVLVSLLPASVLDPSPLDFEAAGFPELDLAAMRDQRLMQASAGEPPPLEQRVAVDGLFMLPLRVALDQAPRSSQQPTETRHA